MMFAIMLATIYKYMLLLLLFLLREETTIGAENNYIYGNINYFFYQCTRSWGKSERDKDKDKERERDRDRSIVVNDLFKIKHRDASRVRKSIGTR